MQALSLPHCGSQHGVALCGEEAPQYLYCVEDFVALLQRGGRVCDACTGKLTEQADRRRARAQVEYPDSSYC